MGGKKCTRFLCGLGVAAGDVGAVGSPLIGVCSEAPWVIRTIGVTAVVLSEVPVTHTQTTI